MTLPYCLTAIDTLFPSTLLTLTGQNPRQRDSHQLHLILNGGILSRRRKSKKVCYMMCLLRVGFRSGLGLMERLATRTLKTRGRETATLGLPAQLPNVKLPEVAGRFESRGNLWREF